MDDGRSPVLLAGLTEAQRAAVTSEAGVLCVVAGAGSGKTTVLTRRIAWRVAAGTADAEHSLVVTFTRKAAGELRGRLARLGASGVWAGTFHAAAFAQLRRHWADTSARAPALMADTRGVMREVLAAEPGLDPRLLEPLLAEASWARARMVSPADYPEAAAAAGRAIGVAPEQVGRVLARFAADKRRRSVLDLDDLVVECASVLEQGGPTAAAVRWRFRHLFVDEFQDVNPAQWRLLSAWRQDRDDLCVVGDPRQAVYAWNGSDPSLLLRLPSLLPGAEVLRLEENHRSSASIVSAAAAVLGAGSTTGGPERATAGDEPQSAGMVEGPVPVVHGFDDDAAEAAAVVRWLRATRRPDQPWHHHAVLARTNARLEPVAAALGAAGIPFRRAGGRHEAQAIAAVLRHLRSADRGTPVRAALVDALADAAESRPVAPAGGAAPGAAVGEAADVIGRLVDEFAADDVLPTVGGFLAWLAANPGATEVPAAADAVELATFHRAKGLEWAAVAVVGLEDGTVPIAYAVDDAARAEERRLFYVALTRPSRALWCSWAAGTGADDGRRARRPSPFLEAVRAAAAPEGAPPPELAVRRIAELRSRLTAAS